MATATKKSVGRRARVESATASLEFLTYRDNCGLYRWEIIDGGGESLAQSGSFDSEAAAGQAAHTVFEGASSARFTPDTAKERETVAV